MNAVPLLASSVAKPLLISCKNTHIPPNFKIPPGIARSPPRAKVAAKTSLVNNPNCHYSASTETEISRSEAFNKGELRRKEQKAQSCAFKQIRAEKFGLHLVSGRCLGKLIGQKHENLFDRNLKVLKDIFECRKQLIGTHGTMTVTNDSTLQMTKSL